MGFWLWGRVALTFTFVGGATDPALSCLTQG